MPIREFGVAGMPSVYQLNLFWTALRVWLLARGLDLYPLKTYSSYMPDSKWCTPLHPSSAPLPYATCRSDVDWESSLFETYVRPSCSPSDYSLIVTARTVSPLPATARAETLCSSLLTNTAMNIASTRPFFAHTHIHAQIHSLVYSLL